MHPYACESAGRARPAQFELEAAGWIPPGRVPLSPLGTNGLQGHDKFAQDTAVCSGAGSLGVIQVD